MTLEQHPPRLRSHSPLPRLLRLQRAIIDFGYSPVSTPVIAFRTDTMQQLWGDNGSSAFTFGLFFSLTICSASAMATGDVSIYLVCWILYIIDCYMTQDIFCRIDIMCCWLPYVFGYILSLKTLVLYIYRWIIFFLQSKQQQKNIAKFKAYLKRLEEILFYDLSKKK
jgi:hypothetical protein